MATATQTETATIPSDQCVEMHDIDWKGYSTMLRLRGERRGPRMVYLDGSLYLVTTSFPHERFAERLGAFVFEVAVGLDIPFVPSGGTTLRRRKKQSGVEGDKTFYFANEQRVRGKSKIDLRVDPPPDLAIEAVFSHAATASIEVYRRLGVPEVWVCEEAELRILVRQADGRYAESETSVALPFLKGSEIFAWISRPQTVAENEWGKELRRWIQQELAQRTRPGHPQP